MRGSVIPHPFPNHLTKHPRFCLTVHCFFVSPFLRTHSSGEMGDIVGEIAAAVSVTTARARATTTAVIRRRKRLKHGGDDDEKWGKHGRSLRDLIIVSAGMGGGGGVWHRRRRRHGWPLLDFIHDVATSMTKASSIDFK